MPTRNANDTPADDPNARAMAQARARVYGLLAAAFDGEIDRLVTALDDRTFVDLAAVLPIAIETDDLVVENPDERALKIGYDNLFVVPGDHYIPPFASAHATDPSEEFESDSPYHTAGESGELLGDPAAAMARLYDAAGFEPTRGDDIPDHLAACFEFMRALCEREAALLDENDASDELAGVRELQASTLARLGWLDAFEEAVASEDTVEGVFAAVARIARTFTAWDAREGVAADTGTAEPHPDTDTQ
ncbi:TorD/DmsD family molecular chaperone [Halohasta salina]|uniref:TorD/DmsD family molecular chaperone n=1 Tax=Halohasta salina TaxID=2961621 RepID=UPI0020A56BB9|nr:molecular chaperone TorD family protein [Halohasta salina]